MKDSCTTFEPDAEVDVLEQGDAAVVEEPPCFEDHDGDGRGTAAPRSCSPLADDAVKSVSLVSQSGDCDDNDPARSPSLSDVCGDGIDNDCSGVADDEANNACGGSCLRPLDHQPGEACDNGLLGACRREGQYACATDTSTRCDAVDAQPSPELCGDNMDDDCDGHTDEADAVDVLSWFQDCDGDGYAASTEGSIRACRTPSATNGCSWTSRIPQPAAHSNWDCDDTNSSYNPKADFGLPEFAGGSADRNCDGVLEREPAVTRENVLNPAFGPTHTPLCPATMSCNQCASTAPRGAQWVTGGQATDIAPACSASMTDFRTYRGTLVAVYGTSCGGNNTFASDNRGVQRCR